MCFTSYKAYLKLIIPPVHYRAHLAGPAVLALLPRSE